MLRACCFRYGSPVDPVNLAVGTYSLARFSKRTPRRCSTASRRLRRFHAVTARDRLISGPLHFPSRVLCSFHSRYYCAIGLGTCSGFGDGASEFTRDIQRTILWDPPNHRYSILLQGFHPLWRRVPADFEFGAWMFRGPATPHPRRISHPGSVCPTPPSIASTDGIAVAFFSSAY